MPSTTHTDTPALASQEFPRKTPVSSMQNVNRTLVALSSIISTWTTFTKIKWHVKNFKFICPY